MQNGGDKAAVWVGVQINLVHDMPSGRVQGLSAAHRARKVLPGGHK